jgi:hypothetical protein
MMPSRPVNRRSAIALTTFACSALASLSLLNERYTCTRLRVTALRPADTRNQ